MSLSLESKDANWMKQALLLAAQGRYTTHPNPNVGCIILDKAGQLVGQGWHQQSGGPHAEVFALEQAGKAAEGGTAYVTLEPCSHYGKTPPCAKALIEAKLARVVVAQEDPNPQVSGRGIQLLRDAGIEVQLGVGSAEATALNRAFLHRCRTGRPWVQVKLAASLDGRTALKNGLSQWITGPDARHDVHLERAQTGAILTGADTVIKDDPQLNVRLQPENYPGCEFGLDIRQPARVVVDTRARVQATARIFQDQVPVYLVRIKAPGLEPARALKDSKGRKFPAHVQLLFVPERAGKADLSALLETLGQLGFLSLWCEAGYQLAGALIQQNLADELILYMAPKLMGPDAHPLLALPLYETMTELPEFNLSEVRQIEQDVKLRYQRRLL